MKEPQAHIDNGQDEPGLGKMARMMSRRRFYVALLLVAFGLIVGSGKGVVDCYLETRQWTETWRCLSGQSYTLARAGAMKLSETSDLHSDLKQEEDPSTARQGRTPIPLDIPHSGILTEDVSDLSKPWYWPYQPLLLGGLAGIILLGYFLYEWYLRSRGKYLRAVERHRSAPLYWDIKVPGPLISLAREKDFRTAIKKLQPLAAARGDSSAAAYLVLIEQSSSHDHLAMLYDQVAHYLWRDDFPVVRYFFQQDPRSCWDEKSAEALFLDELQARHSDAQLILVSSSQRFFDPLTGEKLPWVQSLHAWEHRVLMTPDPPLSWGYREEQLAAEFTFLPASIDALGALAQVLEHSEAPPLSYWIDNNQYPPLPDPEMDTDPLESLTHYLTRRYQGREEKESSTDARAMQAWLGACALYPELTWDLTLALGQGIGRAYQIELCTPRKLYKLVSLPWFREGHIPSELRTDLLQSMSKRDMAISRQVLVELLQAHAPPEGSYAASEHKLHLAIQEAQLKPGFLKRLKLARQVQDYSFNHEFRDNMSVQFLRRVPLALPNWLRDSIFVQGIPALGLQRWMRGTLAFSLATLLLLNVDYNRWLVLYQFQGERYYLTSETDKMRFFTHQGNIAVAEANLEAARQYYLQSQQISQALAAEDYVAPDFNLGVVALEQGSNDSAQLHFTRVQEKVAHTLANQSKPNQVKKDMDSIGIRAKYNEGLLAYRSQELDASEAAFRVSSQSDSLYAASRYAEGVILLQKALDSQGADRSNKLRLAYQRFEEAARQDTTLFYRQQGLKPTLQRLRNSSPDSVWQDYLNRIELLWTQPKSP